MIYAQWKSSLPGLVRGAVLLALLLCIGNRNAQAATGAWGSLINAEYVAEEPFTDEQVGLIRHGATSREDILAWFGPPLAIARSGVEVKVPRPALHQAGSDDVPSSVLFQRFGREGTVPANRIIYYYHSLAARQTLANAVVPMSFDVFAAFCDIKVKMLWILIDRETGIVMDHQLEELKGRESDGRFIPRQPEEKGGTSAKDIYVP